MQEIIVPILSFFMSLVLVIIFIAFGKKDAEFLFIFCIRNLANLQRYVSYFQ